ncbi:ABC transporter ATP-binding protein/permease [Tropicibacter sp. S64]|uniref:ABC transporter ATP-binding protein/permease n=1 Tax=Tropicibacter sp. S64 TaxID=3415122 RepID=UPI003C7DA037
MTDPLQPDAPSARALRQAAGLFIGADLMWPVQAFAAASALAGWLDGQAGLGWIALFGLAGLFRATLRSMGSGLAFAVGQVVVSGVRRTVLQRQARHLNGPLSSAEIAALVADKVPLLGPYLSRYRIALTRVRVVPLVFLALAVSQSWAAGVVLMVAGPLIPVFMVLVGLAAKEASERHMVEIGAVNRVLVDRIAALPDILLLDGYARARAQFETRIEALRVRTMAVLRVAFLSSTVLELFAALGVAMIAVYVGFSLLGVLSFGTWGAPLSVTQGVFLLLLAPEFFQPLRDLAASWHDKAAAEAVAGELRALEASPGAAVLGQGARETLPTGKVLRLENAVAQGVSLPDMEIGAGQSIALTGPSGSGKSTTLSAIAGLLRLEAGQITLDGLPLDDTNADGWRARLALVSQNPHFADMALRDWLDPDGLGGAQAALREAGAERIVADLPKGLDTRLGESGAGVSGGEARRLMLARALLRQADVILADEPTADLDEGTARQVIQALIRAKTHGAVVIVATHDPVLAAAMDRQIPLGGGA